MTVEGRCGSCEADVVHFEVMGKEIHTTTEWNLSATDVPVVGERVPLADPVASINCTLVPGSVPQLPPAVFSVCSNKVQLLPCLRSEPCYRRTVQSHWCVCVCNFRLIFSTPWNFHEFHSNPLLTLKATALSCSTSEEEERQLWGLFLLLSALWGTQRSCPLCRVVWRPEKDLRIWMKVVWCKRNVTLDWLKITGELLSCAIHNVLYRFLDQEKRGKKPNQDICSLSL